MHHLRMAASEMSFWEAKEGVSFKILRKLSRSFAAALFSSADAYRMRSSETRQLFHTDASLKLFSSVALKSLTTFAGTP